MRNEESRTDLGLVRIHKNAIVSIATLAAQEVEGVKRIAASLKFLPGIRVEINKNEEVKIDIPLVLKYGYNIPEVSGRVQENVRNGLEKMTSISLKEINIKVRGIERG